MEKPPSPIHGFISHKRIKWINHPLPSMVVGNSISTWFRCIGSFDHVKYGPLCNLYIKALWPSQWSKLFFWHLLLVFYYLGFHRDLSWLNIFKIFILDVRLFEPHLQLQFSTCLILAPKIRINSIRVGSLSMGARVCSILRPKRFAAITNLLLVLS